MSVSSLSFTDTEDFDVLSQSPLSSPNTPAVITMSLNDNITPVSLSPPMVSSSGLPTPAVEQENQSPRAGSEGGQTYERHQRFYFADGNVTFLVGDTLYRVHQYFFQRDSAHFANLLLGHPLSEAADASGPIALDDVECSEFDALLSILYPADFQECEVKTVEAWTSVLRLSTKWSFASIRKLAIDRLEPIASAIDKVVLGRTYTIDAWLRPRIFDDVILVVTVREGMRARRQGVSRGEVEGLVDSHLDPVQHAATAKKADEVVRAVAEVSPKLAPPSASPWGVAKPVQNGGWGKLPPASPWKRQVAWDKRIPPLVAPTSFDPSSFDPSSPLPPANNVQASQVSPPGSSLPTSKCFTIIGDTGRPPGGSIAAERASLSYNRTTTIVMAANYDNLLAFLSEPPSPSSAKNESALLEPYTYITATPGKEIRAEMIAAFNNWLNVPAPKLQLISRVVSMLHNASLLVDDIEDDSQLRRGQPVAHKIYGVPQTINTANYVYFLAYKELFALRSSAVSSATVVKTGAGPATGESHTAASEERLYSDVDLDRIVTNELLNLHRGQGLELLWRDSLSCPTEEEYIGMVNNKTGGLFRVAVKLMMACATTNSTVRVRPDRDYVPLVNLIGVYFQIRDDYMNLQSNQYATNKGFAEDLTEGKFSFPIVHAVRADTSNRQVLNVLQKRPTTPTLKTHTISYLKTRTKSFEYTLQVLRKLEKQVQDEIERLGGNLKLQAIVDMLHVNDDE
ncbi:hypothetical protein EVG20_g1772 [Dentipellis fragilis]|uniref:(2E,6E)-farnesyl diphosphate synthase n=1 Tax=Dentipellis fragilis TaxID=205917 RepID=A0A4Y9ZBM8_9AGAM|nr:hypothetical protein EVG20_g1772 [Dentipellis fragilis]